jgi:ferredoxin-NADP reductase
MVGAGVNTTAGTIRFIVLEQGASSKIFATLRSGDPIAVMGPTGAKISIPQNETVMIMGGRLAIATILGLAPMLKAAGNRILYIACLSNAESVYCQTELEQLTDAILWVTATGQAITPRRGQDCCYVGDFVTALQLYARGELAQIDLDLQLYAVNKVFIVGPAQMVRRIQQARNTSLHEYFQPQCHFTASVHGAMQCMLKGVCAQCLQWQIDPVTQKRTKAVFACSWQNQPMDIIDISHLNERLTQNRLQESLTNLWLDYLFMQYDIHRV